MKNNRFGLTEGKTAVVTGAGQGIGAAIAEMLGANGAFVIVTDINLEKAKETAAKIVADGGRAVAEYFNVANFTNLKAEVDKLAAVTGRIDIWVNNAGITGTARVEEITLEDWDRMQTLDIKSVFFCTQAVFEIMKRQNYGKLVHISSISFIMSSDLLVMIYTVFDVLTPYRVRS